jgi:hypothetical protein
MALSEQVLKTEFYHPVSIQGGTTPGIVIERYYARNRAFSGT